PNVAPDAVNMTLFGPGVMDMTNEYVAKGRGSIMGAVLFGRTTNYGVERWRGRYTDGGVSLTVSAADRYGPQRGGGSWLLSFSAAPRNTGRHRSSSSRRETREAC